MSIFNHREVKTCQPWIITFGKILCCEIVTNFCPNLQNQPRRIYGLNSETGSKIKRSEKI